MESSIVHVQVLVTRVFVVNTNVKVLVVLFVEARVNVAVDTGLVVEMA